ncbi:putative uncharacterized protein [Prevotella sp. CAG:1031]|nr:putative uncharacterized protein [Prevotella sp. CAG:1031]
MQERNKIRIKECLVSGSVGATLILLIGVIIYVRLSPINVAPVYMLNTSCVTDSVQSQQLDSLRCEHLEVLRDLENKGLLLSPVEYTSHLSSFYNGLIAFLIGIFVIFTIGGIVAVRFISRREIEEAEQEIRNETRGHILSQLSSMMNDSKSFQETTLNALTGRFEDRIIRQEQIDAVEASIEELKKITSDLKENIDFLYENFSDIEDSRAAQENISE